MWNPIILFFLLVVGAVVVAVLVRRTPKFGQIAAVIATGLSLLYWLLLRAQIPVTSAVLNWSNSAWLPDVIWRIDDISWPVTFWLLLLLFVTMIVRSDFSSGSRYKLVVIMLLAAVALVAVWANSLLGMVLGWSGLLVVWGIGWGWIGSGIDSSRFVQRLGLLLAAVLLLWLASASGSMDLAAENGAPRSATMVLLAGVVQMGIWPFTGWRPKPAQLPPELALWLVLVPVVTGAVLLLRALPIALTILPAGDLLLTLAGLLGLLVAVRQAWARLHLPLVLASYLMTAIVHLLLLTAVWGNSAAFLAMLQYFILSSGIFYLMVEQPLGRPLWWRWLAPGAALAALAGLPLTVGLLAHLAVYDNLLLDGRWLLLIVVVFLQMPLLTAGIRLFWPVHDRRPQTTNQKSLVQDGVLLLLALGLISGQGFNMNTNPFSWLALFAVPVGGLLLLRFTPEFRRTAAAVRHAFTFRLPRKSKSEDLQSFTRGMGAAFREAAAILEGDGSLLWLFILILILMLAR